MVMKNAKESGANGDMPAFSAPNIIGSGSHNTINAPSGTGLTKRELFAAMAMQGIVSSIHSEYEYQRIRLLAQASGLSTVSEWTARDACKQADALLAALSAEPKL